MDWRLREATGADLPLLVRHRDAMWIEMGRVAPGEPDPTSPAYGKWLLARMRKGRLRAFIVEGPKRNALASGGVWFQEVQPRPGHMRTTWGYILSIYVEPRHRRKGIARAVVAACIEAAREAGCTRACLHASKEGKPLYQQLGFERTQEMWLDLRPPHRRPRRRKSAARPAASAPANAKRAGG